MNIFSYIPETISLWGSGQTLYGISNAYQGNILNGMRNTLIGMNLMKLGCVFYSSVQTPTLMKLSLCANNALIAVKGIGDVAQGIRNHSLGQAAKGVAQVTFGVAATAAIVSLDDKVINRARIISSCVGLTLSHALTSKEDFARGKKKDAVGGLFFVLVGLALTTYMVYDTYKGLNCTPYSQSERTLSQQQCESFVESHQDELNQMDETKSESGNWTQIGAGKSKVAFFHPELPHDIIKVSLRKIFNVDDYLQIQFEQYSVRKKYSRRKQISTHCNS